MLYGAAYYHEYQPYERLEQDIDLMKEMNLTVVRLGESTWYSWEPEDGVFKLDWMDRVIDAMHAADIKVIFGTPTYAIPPWMAKKHPEVMAQHHSGTYVPYGYRQNMNHAHPAFRYYAERVIRKLISHYASHPAIIGYQIDNETSSGQLHNPDVFQKFLWYLKDKYKTVDNLNEVWGLTYWSHRINEWDELWKPDGNSTPGYDLDWRRFQSQLVTDLLDWEAQIVREYARPDQFITQCFVGAYSRPEANVFDISKSLDIVAINPYHVTQSGLELDPQNDTDTIGPEWMTSRQDHVGVSQIFLNGDWARGAKEQNFLITELNANSIGGSSTNYPGYEGQLRQAVYTFISKGANMVAYWHWHTLHYGFETYWGGVLGHSLEKGRIGREFEQIGAELIAHSDILTDLSTQADVGFLYHEDSKYALSYMPALSQPGTGNPDPLTYERVFDNFYRMYFNVNAQTAIVHPEQEFEKYPLLVVPALYAADDALLERLVAYAKNGGHLLLTFRSGYGDEFARARWAVAPGILRDAVGASYQEYSNLMKEVLVKGEGLDLPEGAAATAWADGLELESAEALATYQHPHFGQFPAIVTKVVGKGRVTYCGTLPNMPLGEALAAWTMNKAGIDPVIEGLPTTVRVTSTTATSGERLLFFTNWSWTPQTLPAIPGGGKDLLANVSISESDTLELGAWDVKIIVQAK
ncbi:beta-galactosidase [Phototrophicus methaneseepsis]|uniref:Beta-galactosidase n=1 Tax=Phototrophicus methaneseepsis TaxID=2710758 RepID=A0A7S8E5U3_9CHLR|nr:beta-galactosidase [Phototrophicus methaneseepsis]QPC80824.1 beta-galactosidase [Phototrophicus methaneseepsis]